MFKCKFIQDFLSLLDLFLAKSKTAVVISILVCSMFTVAVAQAETKAKQAAEVKPIMLNQAVAIVNNSVVTKLQLDAMLQQIKEQIVSEGLTPPDKLTLERQALKQLVLIDIVKKLAKINNITISNSQVEQAIANVAARNGITVEKMQQVFKSKGQSFQTYKETIRQQLLVNTLEQKAVAGHIMVTPAEIDNFIAAEKKNGSPNTKYEVEHILITLPENPTPDDITKAKQEANDVLTKIKSGLDFKQAAVKYSQAADAAEGGNLGWNTLANLPTIFVKPVKSMSIGEVSAPIQSASGFHIIKLVDQKTPKSEKYFVEEYHVKQILIKLTPIVDSEKAKTLLYHIIISLNNGGDFNKLAKSYGQNTLTNASDGDMGWIRLTDQDPKFIEQVKASPLNKVSKPFETSDGWQIIEVVGKKKVDNTEEYQREQVAQAIFQQKAKKAVEAWQAKIRAEAYVKILVPELKAKNI